MSTSAVHMTAITKRFGAVTALDAVSLNVQRQTLHAVVGENGAGKTTLMRILYGAWQPDEGTVQIDGKPVSFKDSREAIEHGIGMVSQHYAIIPELTCLENLVLGAEGLPILPRQAMKQRAQQLAERMGFNFDWDRPASELSPAGAQKLEILKLLWRNAEIMILDEPTAMLSPADSDALFASLHQLAAEGATVILVTHRLPEVMEHCRTVSVLREGRLIAEKAVAGTTSEELASMIVGGAVPLPEHGSRGVGEVRLTLRNVTVKGDRGNEAVRSASLEAKAGEIVGIAGVDGSGQRELFQAITGVRKIEGGTIQPAGTPAERIQQGVRLIPEDRHEEGVIEDWSLEENSALGLQWFSPLARGASINSDARHDWATSVAERFETRHGGLNQPISSLSGGNQQRFVAARALGFSPKVLLAFQPARGLDIGATAEVYRGIRQACDEGATALVVSFDLDELLEHCDRILVINGGRLLEPSVKERSEIGKLMVS